MTDEKSHGEKRSGRYVREVRRHTQRYFEDLLADNQKLRLRLESVAKATLEPRR